jgi:deazaflavin-dependent oxidoreductase (nitroreductase family)
MSDVNDWNANIIKEFRENDGKVGGGFEGAPMVLVHHVGRRSGRDYVNPMVYLADPDNKDTIYVFASKAGHPTHPDWFHNLILGERTKIERGTEIYEVTVTEITGQQRDDIYAEQASRMPGFAEYEKKTEGIRTIPVLALTRA